MARVLVVDDEIGISEALEDVLSEEGFTVDVAPNGKAALEAIRAAPPDLVLMDYMMPVMDGRELLIALRSDAKLTSLPVIMMSAMPETSIPSDVKPDHFLRKPFDIEAMLGLIEQLLAGRRG